MVCVVAVAVALPSANCWRTNVLDVTQTSDDGCHDKSVISYRCTNCLFEGFFDVEKKLKDSVDDKLLYSWACSSPSFQPK